MADRLFCVMMCIVYPGIQKRSYVNWKGDFKMYNSILYKKQLRESHGQSKNRKPFKLIPFRK